ncbi:hypothetical protein SDC9_191922 [bioreactor metagenome]|uniref:Uncharacterized protein n=1 Tax=bioreactor metagenome TaxID=1076179 RepID=A0A645HZA3_9ZZZZ
MLGVQHQRNMHRFFPASRRLFAMQQVQEVTANGIIVSFRLNTLAVMAVVIPVQKD